MTISACCQQILERELGSVIEQVTSLTGGDSSKSYRLLTVDSRDFFFKCSENLPVEVYNAEATGLAALRSRTSLIIPEVVCTVSVAGSCGIVMELLREVPQDSMFALNLAAGIAELHQCSADEFGFESNNYIGRTKQSNCFHSAWGDFFINERLGFQVELAKKQGWLKRGELELFYTGAESIQARLNALTEGPVLLHGDLWSGNVIATDRGAALIDPAVYYGNREADMAFTEMFSGFSEEFYREYTRLMPMATGYQERKELYNLYHLLNHANMFAGAYCTQVINVIRRL